MVDERERKSLWAAIGALAGVVIAEGVLIFLQSRDLNLIGKALIQHLDDEFQRDVDDAFEDIAEHYDE